MKQVRKADRRKIKPFPLILENDSEKYLSCLSRQSSETKPSTELVLVSRERLLYLEFKKPNKLNVYNINLFEKFNFSQSQNNC